jgi:hypothetical protein
MKITLNSSCSTQKDVMIVSPIDGNAYLEKNYVKPGVWTSNVIIGEVDSCSGASNIVKAGTECKLYSESGTGKGVMVQKTVAYDGGTSSVPYKQIILTFMGAEE